MFTTKSTKKYYVVLIGTLFVIYSFSILGCSRKLSDRDMREILPPYQKQTPAHTILGIGNKLPRFDFNDVTASHSTIYWTAGKEFYSGREYGPNIRLSEKGAWIELKNGTRYICATQGGCRIDWINFAIIEGEIEVSHNK